MTGIDPSESLICLAQNHSQQMINAPKFLSTTIEDYAKHNVATHDVVVASEVIEHVSDKESFLAASVCSLKVGGNVNLSVS